MKWMKQPEKFVMKGLFLFVLLVVIVVDIFSFCEIKDCFK